MKKLYIVLLIIGILIPIVVIGFYIYRLAIPAGFELSGDVEDWSAFGGYIGGVLGPIYAFLAFGGVLLTVYLQRQQIEQLNKQANLEELQRLISSISQKIDEFFNKTPKVVPQKLQGRTNPFTIFSMLAAGGTAALRKPKDYIDEANNNEIIAAVKSSVSSELSIIAIELHQLTWCFQEYTKAGGNIIVVEFYRKRYEAAVCWMDLLEFFEEHRRIQEYFEPKKLRPFLSE